MSEPQSCCQAKQCRSSLRVSIHSSRVKLFQSRPATGFLRTRDDTAAMFILVVTLPSFAQNIPKPVISQTQREENCVSDERYASEQRSLLPLTPHRSNFRMTTCLFSTSVRANHQHPRSPHHAKTAAQIFFAALVIRAQTRSNTSNQPYTRSFWACSPLRL